MKKSIPAGTVDAAGNVWETRGENIRHGAKEFSKSDIKDLVDVLFPVGSVYCGENAMITSVGTWEQVVNFSGKPYLQGDASPSGNPINHSEYTVGTNNSQYPSLRMFRRIA